jgi:hypothetical protein
VASLQALYATALHDHPQCIDAGTLRTSALQVAYQTLHIGTVVLLAVDCIL